MLPVLNQSSDIIPLVSVITGTYVLIYSFSRKVFVTNLADSPVINPTHARALINFAFQKGLSSTAICPFDLISLLQISA